ncbi:hypothetical protein DVH24_023370 [Malus domestica]|uniref:Uncharacterized protein n=1 Tax=Malus domestica TaxID=3750 RepID=A0A498KM37_MALDO|nr:hypothetical protein DVH24_023370 [Malus domestica]
MTPFLEDFGGVKRETKEKSIGLIGLNGEVGSCGASLLEVKPYWSGVRSYIYCFCKLKKELGPRGKVYWSDVRSY